MTSVVLFGTGAGIAYTFFNMLSCGDAIEHPQEEPDEEGEEAEGLDASCQAGADSEPPSPSQSSFNRWWVYGGIAAATILAALGVCTVRRSGGKRKRAHSSQDFGDTQAAKPSRWVPATQSMHAACPPPLRTSIPSPALPASKFNVIFN